ncbi:hypothetical protein ACFL6U_10575 [Planctomycetota bacterium]
MRTALIVTTILFAVLFCSNVQAVDYFQESDGIIVMDAEHFMAANRLTDDRDWTIENTLGVADGFVGDGYLDTVNDPWGNPHWNAQACEVTYNIFVINPGTYNVWVRRWAPDDNTNSAWHGMDGVLGSGNDNLNSFFNRWVWVSMGTEKNVTAGPHVFHIRRREPMYKIDRIVLSLDPTPFEKGSVIEGPEESVIAPIVNAYAPDPEDGGSIEEPYTALTWAASDLATSHNVYLGVDRQQVADGSGDTLITSTADTSVLVGVPGSAYSNPLAPGATYYWRIEEVNPDHADSPWAGSVWSFTYRSQAAFRPSPADGEFFVTTNAQLSWSPGLGAAAHFVVFGASRVEVEAVGVGEGMPSGLTTFDPGALEQSKNYYWRVDEFDGTEMHQGAVWTFSTVTPDLGTVTRERWENVATPGGADVMANVRAFIDDPAYPDSPTHSDTLDSFTSPSDPNLTITGGRMHGQLHVPVTGDYIFTIAGYWSAGLWLSADEGPADTSYDPIASTWHSDYQEWDRYGFQQSIPVSLEGGKSYYILAVWAGGEHCSVAMQGPTMPDLVPIPGTLMSPYTPPVKAYGAVPRDGAANVSQQPALRWNPGASAAQQNVYLGTDASAVAQATPETEGIFQGTQETLVFDPGMLAMGTQYFWRIDGVNDGEAGSPWTGKVWTFTTASHVVVDDFERYGHADDDAPVWETWIDGFTNGASGSTAGLNDPPYVDINVKRDGRQSLPIQYNNSGAFMHSEVERSFDPVVDLTQADGAALVLYFYGNPGNTIAGADNLYVGLEDDAGQKALAAYTGDVQKLLDPSWQEMRVPLSAFTGLDTARIAKMVIGIGDRDNPQAGGAGVVNVDGIVILP